MSERESVSQTIKPRSGASLGVRREPKEAPGLKAPDGATIRLLAASRPPATHVERLAIDILKREGSISFTKLLERVARELYSDEVRSGAWVLDIGLYGPNLFVPDVILELESGNGILWKFEQPGKERDGILSDLS